MKLFCYIRPVSRKPIQLILLDQFTFLFTFCAEEIGYVYHVVQMEDKKKKKKK